MGNQKNVLTSRHGNKRPFWQYAIGTLEAYFNVLTLFEDSGRIDPL